MITSVVLGAVTLKCDDLNKSQEVVFSRDVIPGREEEVIQQVAKKSKDLYLHGMLIGVDMDTDKTTLEGYRNTVVTYTDSVESFSVLITTVEIPTTGGQPNHYLFSIRGVKVWIKELYDYY